MKGIPLHTKAAMCNSRQVTYPMLKPVEIQAPSNLWPSDPRPYRWESGWQIGGVG